MDIETWRAMALIIPPVSVLISRIWSMFEHKGTKKAVKQNDMDIKEIKIYINGDTTRRIEEARQAGILEGIQHEKNRKNNSK